MEEWRPWRDGTWEASSLGRVRRAKPGKTTAVVGAIHKARIDERSGYLTMGLATLGEKKRTRFVHAIVAESFHGPRPLGYVVNHINFDRLDNRPENLEFVTQSDNLKHSGLRIAAAQTAARLNLSAEQVRDIRARAANGERHCDIAADFGMTESMVSHIKHRRSHAGVE